MLTDLLCFSRDVLEVIKLFRPSHCVCVGEGGMVSIPEPSLGQEGHLSLRRPAERAITVPDNGNLSKEGLVIQIGAGQLRT